MKKIFNLSSLALMTSLTLLACSSHRKNLSSEALALAPNVMEARVVWLKDKGKKFDFQASLHNTSQSGLIVYLADIACSKGGVTGELKHTFFNTGERTIDFRAGERKSFNFVCKLGDNVSSNQFLFSVRKISANENNDGRSAGKVLFRNLNVPVTL